MPRHEVSWGKTLDLPLKEKRLSLHPCDQAANGSAMCKETIVTESGALAELTAFVRDLSPSKAFVFQAKRTAYVGRDTFNCDPRAKDTVINFGEMHPNLSVLFFVVGAGGNAFDIDAVQFEPLTWRTAMFERFTLHVGACAFRLPGFALEHGVTARQTSSPPRWNRADIDRANQQPREGMSPQEIEREIAKFAQGIVNDTHRVHRERNPDSGSTAMQLIEFGENQK